MADADNKTTTYVKLGSDGNVIEREALTPTDHVNFKGTGWVLKDSTAGRRIVSPKKTDDVSTQSASSVTAHAAAATVAPPAEKSSAKKS